MRDQTASGRSAAECYSGDRRFGRPLPDGRCEEIEWEHLAEVLIVTTDEGPWQEDAFWRLSNADRSRGGLVPNSAEGLPALIEALGALPGFNSQAVTNAMTCTSRSEFLAWRRA